MELPGQAFHSGSLTDHGYCCMHQKGPGFFIWKSAETLDTSCPKEIRHRNCSTTYKRAYSEESSISYSLTPTEPSLAYALHTLKPPKPTVVVLELENLLYTLCGHDLLKRPFLSSAYIT